MKTIENEASSTLEAPAAATTETPEQKAPTKAKAAKQAHRVAPAKAKSGKKATPAKKPAKAPKSKKTAKAKESAGPREGSKTAQVVAMLQRKSGATLRARHPRRAGPIAAGSSIDPFRCSPGSCTECRTGRASQRGSRRPPVVARSPSGDPSGRRQVSHSHFR
jgi:hypothetical protein